MNRRNFLNTGSKVALGAALLSQIKPNVARAAQGEEILVESLIRRNHGHSFDMDAADVLKSLRDLNEQGEGAVLSLDIQGRSAHPHSLALTSELLTSLLVLGSVVVDSSVDAGHSHSVTITMDVK